MEEEKKGEGFCESCWFYKLSSMSLPTRELRYCANANLPNLVWSIGWGDIGQACPCPGWLTEEFNLTPPDTETGSHSPDV